MFKIGEYVSYRSEGICVIKDISTECFGVLGKSEEYYILAPLRDINSTLYVPLNNSLLVEKMQRLLSAEEICELAEKLVDERLVWILESRVRNASFKEILASGDRNSLIILVNTLTDYFERLDAGGRKHTASDDSAYKKAKKMLLDEFSVTTNIKTEEDLIKLLKCECKCIPATVEQ